jgi:hypothetical protein
MSTLKVDTISEKTASGGITFSDDITATLSSSSNVKAPLNASGDAPVYACRAWVNFNGTGTVAIRGNGNASSIDDLGTGYYRVNFDNDMPDLNYSFFATVASQEDDVATQRFRGTGDILKNISYVEFKTVYVSATNGNAAAQDIESINILIMR